MQSGKPSEVRIVRVQFCPTFHCERGDVSVGREVSTYACHFHISMKVNQMIGARIEWNDMRIFEPNSHTVNSFQWRHREFYCAGIDDQSYKRYRHYPRNANSFRAVDQIFPPRPSDRIIRRSVIVSVEQQVGIRYDH